MRRRRDIIAAVELGISNRRVEAINSKIKVGGEDGLRLPATPVNQPRRPCSCSGAATASPNSRSPGEGEEEGREGKARALLPRAKPLVTQTTEASQIFENGAPCLSTISDRKLLIIKTPDERLFSLLHSPAMNLIFDIASSIEFWREKVPTCKPRAQSACAAFAPSDCATRIADIRALVESQPTRAIAGGIRAASWVYFLAFQHQPL